MVGSNQEVFSDSFSICKSKLINLKARKILSESVPASPSESRSKSRGLWAGKIFGNLEKVLCDIISFLQVGNLLVFYRALH